MTRFIVLIQNFYDGKFEGTSILEKVYSNWKDIVEDARKELPDALFKDDKRIIEDLDNSNGCLFAYYENDDKDGKIMVHKCIIKQIKL